MWKNEKTPIYYFTRPKKYKPTRQIPLFLIKKKAMITLKEMAVFNSLYGL